MAESRLTLGRVAGAFGIRGWVKVKSDARPAENILKYRRWWITSGEGYEAKLLQGQIQGGGVVAQISDAAGEPITDRAIAEKLVGAQIQVYRSDLPKLPEGQYYWVDLIGLSVKNLEGVALGQVTDMTSNGAQDVMKVSSGDQQRWIPYVPEHIVKNVDLAAGVIVCDWQPDY